MSELTASIGDVRMDLNNILFIEINYIYKSKLSIILKYL